MKRGQAITDISLNREDIREIRHFTKEQLEGYLQEVFTAGANSVSEEKLTEGFDAGALAQAQVFIEKIPQLLAKEFGLTHELVCKFMGTLSQYMSVEVDETEQQDI